MHRLENVLGQLRSSGVAAKASSGPLVSTTVQMGVAVLVINYPPVNSFNPNTRDAISKAYDEAIANDEVKAIVITGTKDSFMAGADLEYVVQMQNTPGVTKEAIVKGGYEGHDVFNKIESGPKPVVAAINGTALGGGLELALACNARIAVDKASLGLPELSLGIIPGLAGTQRLPRLIGVAAAVTNTLSSKPWNAKAALKLGLIDGIAKPEELLQTAGKLALGIAAGKVPRRQCLQLQHHFADKEEALRVVAGARIESARKAKHVPHPQKYLDAVEEGIKNGPKAGIKKEAEVFADLVLGPVAKALIHFFFASRATAKIPGIPAKVKSGPRKIAVLGGGTMGAGICIAYLVRGYDVILKEVNEKFLLAAVERILDNLARVIKSRKLPTLAIEQILRGFKPQLTYDGFDKVDIVIEAVLENIPLKQQIFQELEKVCSPNAILATNTSTIDVEVIGAKTKALDRIIGLHFFSPAHVMPLLEIVRTKHTSNETIARALAMSKAIGKTPVVSGNCVAFIANRVFFPYGQSAGFLVDAGVDPYRIDKALEKFGMPMGAFRMGDLSGIDIGVHVGEIIRSAYGSRCYVGTVYKHLTAANRLGEKTKAGYYSYKSGPKAQPDPKGLEPILALARADAAKAGVPKIDPKSLSDQDIVELILFPVINECTRVVGEGFARTNADVDICSVMGYGFPAFRGGIMFWGQSKHGFPGGSSGYKYVKERLQQFSQKYGANNSMLKNFFQPSEYLTQLASK